MGATGDIPIHRKIQISKFSQNLKFKHKIKMVHETNWTSAIVSDYEFILCHRHIGLHFDIILLCWSQSVTPHPDHSKSWCTMSIQFFLVLLGFVFFYLPIYILFCYLVNLLSSISKYMPKPSQSFSYLDNKIHLFQSRLHLTASFCTSSVHNNYWWNFWYVAYLFGAILLQFTLYTFVNPLLHALFYCKASN